MSKKYLQLLSQFFVVACLILYGGSCCNAANWYVDKDATGSDAQCTSLYSGGKVDYNLVNAGAHGYSAWQCNWAAVSPTLIPNFQYGAPTFVNYVEYDTTSDLHLAANDTAAKGKGTNLKALLATGGLPTSDIDGNPRPATSAWSIGAYK